MGAFEVFAIVASAIALVFVSWAVFRLTRFPPGTLFVILGAALSILGSKMPGALLETVTLAAPILLGSILFSCGLKLNLRGIAAYAHSVRLSFITIPITLLAIGAFSHVFLGFDFRGALLVGAIGASICSFFVFHITDEVNLADGVADGIMLESSLTEAVVVILALTVYGLSSGVSVVQAFAFGLVFGLLAGIVWVRLMRFASDFPHRDALTLSIVLGIAALCEVIFPNSGMISAFFFGLAMGNAGLLKAKAKFEGLLKFQEDVLMAGGTFFFFYTGLSVSGADSGLVLTGALLWVIVLVLRTVSIKFSLEDEGFNFWLAGLAPKGLSAAIIVQMALAGGLGIASKLLSITLPMLVLSGIFAGIASSKLEGKKPPRVETVATSRKWGAVDDDKGTIGHAYDIEEMKRTINGPEE